MLTEHILASLVHWINGDPAAAWDEGLCVESAIIAEERIRVELSQADSATRITATFGLMDVAMTAKIRETEGQPRP